MCKVITVCVTVVLEAVGKVGKVGVVCEERKVK